MTTAHAMPLGDTGTRTRTRPHPLIPTRDDWVDLTAVLVLTTVAITAFGSSFTGSSHLVVGVLGALIAVVITHVMRAFTWPAIASLVVLIVVFFVLGGPLCLRSLGDSAFIPGAGTLGEVADQAVFGWKDLLTTLPPVDGDGPLLVLPWLVGLLGGWSGTTLAGLRPGRDWLQAILPVAGMTVLLALVVFLGVRHPDNLVIQGATFSGLALGWLALRARRASASVRGGSSGWLRVAFGTALVVGAAALALPVSALVTSDSDAGRIIARRWVEPPFDIGQYPSPLASFRNYVDPLGKPVPGNVFNEDLFTIEGVPVGTPVRFATMDHYDGMVWGATDNALPDDQPGGADGSDSFQRVSSTIDNPVEGKQVDVTVTIGKGYSSVWLPTTGALRSMHFVNGDPRAKAEEFRYNLATSTAVLPSGLHAGDTYHYTATLPDDTLTKETVAGLAVTPALDGTGFLDTPVTQWTEDATTAMGRVLAIADRLRKDGKYSDGVVKDERQYHPGHSIKRLGDEFISQEMMVGNDEQYAAVMALLAGRAGVPARVVMGAIVPEGGVVQGKDVVAWVEIQAADGTWRRLAGEEFIPTEPPTEQLPQTDEPMSGTVVPPPAPIPPPSDAGDQSDADLKERPIKPEEKKKDESIADRLPVWLVLVGKYVGGPLLLIAVLLGLIIGAKVLRRRRRRSATSMSARVVGGWLELVDHARDLGQPVPLGPTVTRREQSAGIWSEHSGWLARRADSHVFGPTPPIPEAAADYWQSIEDERKAMSQAAGRRQRWLAAVNLRSFLRRRTGGRRSRLPSQASQPSRFSGRLQALRVPTLTVWGKIRPARVERLRGGQRRR